MSQPEMIGSFATPDPSPSVRRPSRRRLGALIGAGVAVGAGGAAWQGSRLLTDAPGQAALERLVPREALGAVAVDFKPRSWEQVGVVRRIGDAVKAEDLMPKIRDVQNDALSEFPVFRELQPHLTGSGASAGWEGVAGKADYRYIGIAVVTSPYEVAAILSKRAESMTTEDGVKVASLRITPRPDTIAVGATPPAGERLFAALVDNYLLMASSPEAIRDTLGVWRGKHPALGRDAEYLNFRATLPRDANVIGYVSPRVGEVARQMGEAAYKTSGMPSQKGMFDSYKNLQGGAFSIAMRDQGLRFDSTMQMQGRQMDVLRGMTTLDPKIASRLPADALGFMALAQPSAFYDATEAALTDLPADARKQWDDGKKSFEKEYGLSIANDIRPAFNGDAVFAAYAGDKSIPVHFSALMTDARQAQPAALLEHLQTVVKKQDAKIAFVARQEGSITYWVLPSNGMSNLGFGDTFKGLQSADGKELTLYATVGQSAFAASSRSTLESAVKTYQDGSGFKATAPLPSNAQMLFVVRPRAVVDAIAHLSPETFRAETITAEEARAVWGDQDLIMSGTYTGKYSTAGAFLPLRYEKAISLIARAARAARQNKPAPDTVRL